MGELKGFHWKEKHVLQVYDVSSADAGWYSSDKVLVWVGAVNKTATCLEDTPVTSADRKQDSVDAGLAACWIQRLAGANYKNHMEAKKDIFFLFPYLRIIHNVIFVKMGICDGSTEHTKYYLL